ncbi:MAG TPA: ABC-F family ATP-binding cassette domain-containing protein [Acidimicrobiales bacterium]|nr:ABC-F family ATP-binding cassette domain-containing protein [Acidimicrobiales bacterium]
MLQVRDLAVEVGGAVLMEGVSFTIRARDKVGLVGRNGAGKTSMLKVLGGAADPYAGVVSRTGGLGYLPQDPRLDGVDDATPAVRHILSGRGFDEALTRMEKLRLQMEEDPSERAVARFSRAEEQFRNDGGYSADSEVRRIAAGLGLEPDRLDLPVGALSGGQRRRVEIARILFAGSDVLLLDEPTNHLDSDAKEWLLGFMRAYRGALLVISHDLDLLDEAITRVLHLDRYDEDSLGTMHEYKGTYSQYVVAREKDEVRLAKMAQRQAKEIDRLQTIVDRFGAKATKASMAHSIEKRIGRLEADAVEVSKGNRSVHVRFPAPPPSGRTVLEGQGLAVRYGDLEVFADVDIALERGERLLIMGLNGAGKTSLLKVLAGQRAPDAGTFHLGHQVVAGYYAQEHEGIHAGRTILEHLREQVPNAPDPQLRAIVGAMGLTGDKVHQDAGTLSGGEKTKLALGILVAGRHNLLLLDEPTNNLDPGSREAVAEGLRGWPGSIILVSHDAPFVRDLEPDRVLLMPEGTLDHWADDYLELVEMA